MPLIYYGSLFGRARSSSLVNAPVGLNYFLLIDAELWTVRTSLSSATLRSASVPRNDVLTRAVSQRGAPTIYPT